MAKTSHSPDFDQYDPKLFRETLGTFGTTTAPTGENQLVQLQAKIRQGVKHVELHLASQAKGEFGKLDVPDKYGFEERRTIMQLAKLNQQTLSVHSTLNVTSFSGLSREGFDETQRFNNLKEIDETVKFAAETAKGGAVVMHLLEGIQTPAGELNLPRKYLEKLRKEKPEEYERIMKNYLDPDLFKRQFLDNPILPAELQTKYDGLSSGERKKFEQMYAKEIREAGGRENAWKVFYRRDYLEKIKTTQQSLVVVGNGLQAAKREGNLVSVEDGKAKSRTSEELTKSEIEYLKEKKINPNKLDFEGFQALKGLLIGEEKGDKKEILDSLKKKILITYDNILLEKQDMRYEADEEFFKNQLREQIETYKLKKKELDLKYELHKDEIGRIKKLENEIRTDHFELDRAAEDAKKDPKNKIKAANVDAIKLRINQKMKEKEQIAYSELGQVDYHELKNYNEQVAQIKEQIVELEKKKENTKVLTNELFEKNTSALAHLGLKALRYQLDLKGKAKEAGEKVASLNKQISTLQSQIDGAKSEVERNKLNTELMKAKHNLRRWIGVKEYGEKETGVDIKNRPLYISPENFMSEYGYLTAPEEYKAIIRESWEDFAKKLLGGKGAYKQIKEDYEKETGKKVDKEKALEIAKKHIGGTLDTGHAGGWLKYFRRKEGESEEERLDEFNKWLNDEAESMAKEGIVKHVHFNNSAGKDDDHNLLSSGVLDIHELRARLRKAGLREPLIIEAGGRGAAQLMHVFSAFDVFNPTLKGTGYTLSNVEGPSQVGSSVSDWISVKRAYETRPQYSQYGMGYSTFRHVPPQQGDLKGGWSGTGFF